MSVLLELPHDIVHDVLINWCGLEVVESLDRAVTSRRVRQSLLTHFEQFPAFLPPRKVVINHIHSFYRWIVVRKLRISHLEISGADVNQENNGLNFDVNWTAIKTLVVGAGLGKVEFLPLIIESSCTSLTRLEVHSDHVVNELHGALPRLETLTIRKDCMNMELLLSQVALCTALVGISIDTVIEPSYYQLLENIFLTCVHLRSLKLSCNPQIVQLVLQHCNNIQDLLIESDDYHPNLLSLSCDLLHRFTRLRRIFFNTFDSLEYSQGGGKRLSLYLSHSRSLQEALPLLSVVEGLTSLQLTVSSEENVNSLVDAVLPHSSTLTHLKLNGKATLSSSMVNELLIKFPKLDTLFCHTDAVSSVPFSHPNVLTNVDVSFSHPVLLSVVSSIFQCFPHVVDFCFDKVVLTDGVVGLGRSPELDEFYGVLMRRYAICEDLMGAVSFYDEDADRYTTRMSFRKGKYVLRCLS